MSCQESKFVVDAVFPEHMSIRSTESIAASNSFRRQQRRVLHRETPAGVGGRYRTQPVTFDEIKVNTEQTSSPGNPSYCNARVCLAIHSSGAPQDRCWS